MGWLCAGSLALTQFALGIAVAAFSVYVLGRSPVHWSGGVLLLNLISECLALFVVLLFARPKSIKSAAELFAFKVPKLTAATLMIVLGAALAIVAVYLVNNGGGNPQTALVHNLSGSGPSGIVWLRFIIIITPIVEEIAVRGYIYTAFRGSYSITVSVTMILLIAGAAHFTAITSSWVAAGALLALNLLLCIIRERTDNLWNCVLCHGAYNLVCALV